jgi:hypothetical protein
MEIAATPGFAVRTRIYGCIPYTASPALSSVQPVML